MVEVPNWLKVSGACAAAVVSISVALSSAGLHFPRPAWSFEVERLAGEVLSIKAILASTRLESVVRQLHENVREQESYRTKGQRVPDYLLKERARLETEKRRLETELDRMSRGSD